MKRLLPSLFLFAFTLLACLPPATPPPPTLTPAPSPTATPVPPVGLQPGWWQDAVFYEIFVRSFKDSDGDGIGDFNGITEQLDYLNDGDPNTSTDLGITGIWLMPITQSPSYHGYDVTDYYSVDSEYGSKEDFLRLTEEAHKRGIRIIVDLVLNHTSTQHPWFKASNNGDQQYRDWYIWNAEKPNYRGPWGQDVWYRGKDGFYYAVFWSEMPDLNLANPTVTQEIYSVTRFWLEEMNVDGFRLDAIRHFVENGSVQENTRDTHQWLQNYFQFYKSIDPSAFTVGEAWTETAQVLDYIGDEVDLAFEFDLAENFVRAAAGPLASAATSQMETVLQTYPAGQYATFLTNHDQERVMTTLGGDTQKAKLAAVMLLTAPGVPFLYYGEEIGMSGAKPDEDLRRPMQWTSQQPGAGFTSAQPWRNPPGDTSLINVQTQNADPDSLLNFYRQLIHLRATHPALRTGTTLLLETDTQRLYALLRYDQDEAFLILINSHPKPLTADLYALSLPAWDFGEISAMQSILGAEEASLLQRNPSGGFDSYHPLLEIPAQSAVILRMISDK